MLDNYIHIAVNFKNAKVMEMNVFELMSTMVNRMMVTRRLVDLIVLQMCTSSVNVRWVRGREYK